MPTPLRLPALPLVLLVAFALYGVACTETAVPDPSHEDDASAVHAASHEAEALGVVDFGVSCAPEVVEDFDRAVGFLHHMQYVEARAAFEAIAAADPACGMARWGVAMTLFQPLWPSRPGPDALRRGAAELEAARSAGPLTDREDALVAAAEAFYREPETADWWTRIARWSAAMETAYAARPDDIETAALYALSQLAAAQTASDRMAVHAHAADVLLGIYEREPRHPGAIHYTIHANDVDSRADEAIEVVRSYGEIAPNVPHALHMPTHIFVRLGSWPEVIDWNRRSAAAALNHPAPDGISHHYLHALDYLTYAYLQQGDDARARALVEEVRSEDDPYQGTFISAFHMASMAARYAVERRAWDEARSLAPDREAPDRFWWAAATWWFAHGLGAARTGDAEAAERAETRMAALRDAAKAADEHAFAAYIEIDRRVLATWRAHAAGRTEEALAHAHDAVALEAETQKHPVTPGAVYPAREALGDLLFDLGRADEAADAYEGALAAWPNRFNSLLGAARAAEVAGQPDRARTHYAALLASAGASERPEVREARRYSDE